MPMATGAGDDVTGGAASAAGEAGAVAKKNLAMETTALLQWLSNADNRNIITGAAGVVSASHLSLFYVLQRCAGSAQNSGGMASSKVVTTKDAGFGMLAKSLSDILGYTIDKKQAQNKFTYLERKFHAAKTWHRTSGVGITDEDRSRGLSYAFIVHIDGNYLMHSNRNREHSCEAERHVPQL